MPIPSRLTPLLIPGLLATVVPASAALTPSQQAALAVFQFELGRGGSLAAMEAGDANLATRLITGPVPVPAALLDGLWPYNLFPATATHLEPPLAAGMFPARIPDLEEAPTVLLFARQLRRYVGSVADNPKCPYLAAGHLTEADCALLATRMNEGYTGDPARWSAVIPKAARGLDDVVGRAARVLESHLGNYLAAQRRAMSWAAGAPPPMPPTPETLRIILALGRLKTDLEAIKDPYLKLDLMKNRVPTILKTP